MSLLEQDTINKERVNKLPKLEKEFEASDNKEYKVKLIIDSAVYGKKAKNHFPGFYYIVL